MMDPSTFSSRETWLAYLMGYGDGRRDYEALISTPDAQDGSPPAY